MERSGASAGRGGRAFEDIFQLVVVIFIQTPGREKFPRALQLAGHEAIIRTGVRLQGQTAVSPELPLGAETMGRLEQSDQQGDSNRAEEWNLSQHVSRAMSPALGQQFPAGFLAQNLQQKARRELLAESRRHRATDRKSTRLNSSHSQISYAVFCLEKKKATRQRA